MLPLTDMNAHPGVHRLHEWMVLQGVWLGLFERMKRSDTKDEEREVRHMFQGRGGGEETSEGAERLTDEV